MNGHDYNSSRESPKNNLTSGSSFNSSILPKASASLKSGVSPTITSSARTSSSPIIVDNSEKGRDSYTSMVVVESDEINLDKNVNTIINKDSTSNTNLRQSSVYLYAKICRWIPDLDLLLYKKTTLKRNKFMSKFMK